MLLHKQVLIFQYLVQHKLIFYGDIPCAREFTKEEVESDYEVNAGKVIVETIENRKIDPIAVPDIVVKNHGPFAWGKSSETLCTMRLLWRKLRR